MWSYTLQAGETLHILATRLNTRVTALEAANPGISLIPLKVGQSINIPGLPSVAKDKVAAGEDFDSISKNHRTYIAAQNLNPGINPTDLEKGQIINVLEIYGEGHGSSSYGHSTYMIQEGDTIYSISSKYDSTPEFLQTLNPNINALSLRIGQFINLPYPPRAETQEHGKGKATILP